MCLFFLLISLSKARQIFLAKSLYFSVWKNVTTIKQHLLIAVVSNTQWVMAPTDLLEVGSIRVDLITCSSSSIHSAAQNR